jgi:hypothetical protein
MTRTIQQAILGCYRRQGAGDRLRDGIYLDRLSSLVLADLERPVVITSAKQTTAMQGMGGIGKSVLAAAFARSTKVRRAFGDGIVWIRVGLGAEPLSCIRQLGLALGGALEQYVSMEMASVHLPRLLAEKVCLIVLDDVWGLAQLAPVRDALGSRSRLLFTTRDAGPVTAVGGRSTRLNFCKKNTHLRYCLTGRASP